MTVAVPILEMVTGCAAEVVVTFCAAKVNRLVLKLSSFVIPSPVRFTTKGPLVASPVRFSALVRVPVAVGVKVIDTEQFAPAARVAPQVLALIA